MGMYAPDPLANYAVYSKYNESLPPGWNPYNPMGGGWALRVFGDCSTAVPEPTTVLLLGLGLIGLSGARRKFSC